MTRFSISMWYLTSHTCRKFQHFKRLMKVPKMTIYLYIELYNPVKLTLSQYDRNSIAAHAKLCN